MTGNTSNTKYILKSIRIPLELDAQLEALNINFSKFVREAIEEKLNGKADTSLIEFQLKENRELIQQAQKLLEKAAAKQESQEQYISTLKEQQAKKQKKHAPEEEPETQPTPVFDCIHREMKDGEIFCKKYGQVVDACTTSCFGYKPRGGAQ